MNVNLRLLNAFVDGMGQDQNNNNMYFCYII